MYVRRKRDGQTEKKKGIIYVGCHKQWCFKCFLYMTRSHNNLNILKEVITTLFGEGDITVENYGGKERKWMIKGFIVASFLSFVVSNAITLCNVDQTKTHFEELSPPLQTKLEKNN